MRYVDRRAVAPPPSLFGPDCPAARELRQAAQHFLKTPDKEFEFSVYSAPDVREALNQLFHGKCAYCESKIIGTQPTDIEHFRPKGRVHGCAGNHPGYWWLAATWENLLASCIDCNRRRYQKAEELDGEPLPYKKNGRFNLGKGDLFPILGTKHAKTDADDLDAEDAALIDPTLRDPRAHLQWRVKLGKNVIGPVKRDGTTDQYGLHTYQVFGLNRQGLVDLRTALWFKIETQLILVREMLQIGVTTPGAGGQQMRDLAFKTLDGLEDYAAPTEPYSAMVQDMLERKRGELLAEFAAYKE
jgi:5-methylcytosine-specific restriction endonuclease McrA